MNIFTAHTYEQGITYIQHFVFAMRIAKRLLQSVIAFSLHAVFPFIKIEKKLDLEATVRFINEQNDWIESRDKPKNNPLVISYHQEIESA